MLVGVMNIMSMVTPEEKSRIEAIDETRVMAKTEEIQQLMTRLSPYITQDTIDNITTSISNLERVDYSQGTDPLLICNVKLQLAQLKIVKLLLPIINICTTQPSLEQVSDLYSSVIQEPEAFNLNQYILSRLISELALCAKNLYDYMQLSERSI